MRFHLLVGVPVLLASCLGLFTLSTTAQAQGYICDAPDVVIDEQEYRLLGLVNAYRQSYGLQPLVLADPLISAAGWMSGDMGWRNYFNHTDYFGRPSHIRQADCGAWGGYRGENLAAGTDSADAVFAMWQASPPHNEQMLNPYYRYTGISRYYGPSSTYEWYWVMDLASD